VCAVLYSVLFHLAVCEKIRGYTILFDIYFFGVIVFENLTSLRHLISFSLWLSRLQADDHHQDLQVVLLAMTVVHCVVRLVRDKLQLREQSRAL